MESGRFSFVSMIVCGRERETCVEENGPESRLMSAVSTIQLVLAPRVVRVSERLDEKLPSLNCAWVICLCGLTVALGVWFHNSRFSIVPVVVR